MKSRIKEQGSALHIVIIIVLVLAVLGLLGFVFWQNFINKPVGTQNTAGDTNTSAIDTGSTSATRTLTISEWGIKGDYTGTKEFGYVIESGGYSPAVRLTSDVLVDVCTNTGDIFRFKADEVTNLGPGSTGNPDITAKDAYDTMAVPNISWGAKSHIGDYYYFLARPQSACLEDMVGKTLADEWQMLFGVTEEFFNNMVLDS